MAWQQNWVTQQIIQLSDDLTSLIIQEHQFLYCILHWIFEKYDITVTHSTCYIQPLSFEQWQLWTMVLLHFSLSRHYVMLNLNNLCYSKPILSFGHWAPFETIHQIPPTFLFTYKGLQLGSWRCQAILLGCLGAGLTKCSWQQPRILKMAEIVGEFSLYKQLLHSRSYLLIFILYHES